tara:strand:+ start:238 stop:924 length:687 start_codon:yes stop_codon:yes gene_type:complete
LFATCIIIHIGKNEIIIGADSRNVKKPTESDNMEILDGCKIQKMGSLFCAMSGFTHSEYYEFNSYEIVKLHLQEGRDFKFNKERIKSDLKSKLSTILKKIKTNKKSWEMIVTSENRILDLAIIGEINDELIVYRLGFVLSNPETMDFEVHEEEIICNDETDKYVAFGELDSAKDYLINNLKTDLPQNLIRNAIREQAKAGKITVGEPINILKVKKEKYEWIDNHTCEK